MALFLVIAGMGWVGLLLVPVIMRPDPSNISWGPGPAAVAARAPCAVKPMRLELDDARRRFAAAPVARLATVRPDGRPHLVPIVFALEGNRIYSIVDTKPKASTSLARLRNIEANPHVSLLVDAYSDDWEWLWWVRADGRAMVVADGPDRDEAITLLRAKYPQYLDADLKFGSATIVDVERWVGWTAGG